ncbi:MAG: hypothetical protein HZB56_10650 [Deltaproteobacteria bacterium]|nr:hypothetical protein [Deltaproteobacteria bacterium]
MEGSAARIAVREFPRISVTKLGEYLTASAGRRRKIVEDQKHPPTFQIARYTEAERAIVSFLVDRDLAALEASSLRLSRLPARSEFDAERRQLCVEAIEAFQDVLEVLPLDEARATEAPTSAPYLVVAGVDVSVRPELTVARSGRGGARVGCIKLYFSKNHPLDEKAGAYVSTLLALFAQEHVSGTADDELLLTVDVFGGKVFCAPKARVKRLEDIRAACEEISVRWDSV